MFPSPARGGRCPKGGRGQSVRERAKQGFARTLRSDMTQAERALWNRIRRRQLANCRFRRQSPIGPYVVDFVCMEARLVVEVDGSQHMESMYDSRRDAWLLSEGFRVLRFWNNDVLARMHLVLNRILDALASTRPLPPFGHLPPQAGEGANS